MKISHLSWKTRGFTIVEVLVAIAVLILMTTLLTQMFSSVSQTWLGGQARVDNYSRARVLLDIASEDLRQGVYRPDLAAFPGTNIVFYTRRPGFRSGAADLRDLSLVKYQMLANGVLQRGDLAISWNDSPDEVSFGSTNDLPRSSQLTMRDISPGVLAFQVLYIGTNGLPSGTYNPTNGLKGFAIGLAVIDSVTMKKLNNQQIAGLKAGFVSATSGTNSLRSDWEQYINQNLDWASYPKGLGSGIKLFERHVPLP